MRLLRYWKMVLGLVLVFVAGAVSGAVATKHLLDRGLSRAMNFQLWKAGTMQVLQTKLNLTLAQHEKIERMVDLRGHEIRGQFSSAFHNCGQTLVQLQHEIDQELTPAQRLVHDQMKREFRAELKKKFNFDLPED